MAHTVIAKNPWNPSEYAVWKLVQSLLYPLKRKSVTSDLNARTGTNNAFDQSVLPKSARSRATLAITPVQSPGYPADKDAWLDTGGGLGVGKPAPVGRSMEQSPCLFSQRTGKVGCSSVDTDQKIEPLDGGSQIVEVGDARPEIDEFSGNGLAVDAGSAGVPLKAEQSDVGDLGKFDEFGDRYRSFEVRPAALPAQTSPTLNASLRMRSFHKVRRSADAMR